MIRIRKVYMKLYFLIGQIFLSVILFSSCKSANYFLKKGQDWSQLNKIGILTKSSKYLSKSQAQSVSNEVASIELNKKRFDVVERVALDEILKEIELSQTGLFKEDPKTLQKLKSIDSILLISFPTYSVYSYGNDGSKVKVLGASVNMGGKSSFRTEVSISMRLLSVKTADVLFMCTTDRKIHGSRLAIAAKYVIKKCLSNLHKS